MNMKKRYHQPTLREFEFDDRVVADFSEMLDNSNSDAHSLRLDDQTNIRMCRAAMQSIAEVEHPQVVVLRAGNQRHERSMLRCVVARDPRRLGSPSAFFPKVNHLTQRASPYAAPEGVYDVPGYSLPGNVCLPQQHSNEWLRSSLALVSHQPRLNCLPLRFAGR